MTSRKSELRSIPFWSPALVLCLLCTPLLLGQMRRSWTRFQESSGSRDESEVLAVDGRGNLHVLIGKSSGSSAIVKFDPSGAIIWEASLEIARPVLALDGGGDVYIAGGSTVARYAGSGERLWSARFEGEGVSHAVKAIDVGPGGAYVTGGSSAFADSFYGVTTARFDPQGARVWAAHLGAKGEPGIEHLAGDLEVDADGSVCVAATRAETARDRTVWSLLALKYGSDGELRWLRRHTPSEDWPYVQAIGLSLDGSGNVLLAGGIPGGLILMRFDPGGVALWVRSKEIADVGPFHDLAVDAAGNAFVGGGEDGDYVAVKYGPEGEELWMAHHRVADSVFADNAGTRIAVDRWGDLYVSGAGMTTLKVGSGGESLWVEDFDVEEDGHESTSAIAVSDAGILYVTGVASGPKDRRSVTIKYVDPSRWSFVRGDGNSNGRVEPISDAVAILTAVFLRPGSLPCLAAADVNGDGAVEDASDAVGLLTWGFLEGPAPQDPFPECGPGGLADDAELGCEAIAASCR